MELRWAAETPKGRERPPHRHQHGSVPYCGHTAL